MRKLSMEKLGETLKRKGEEDGGATPRKRASGSETIVCLREKAERDFDLRKEELETRKRDQNTTTTNVSIHAATAATTTTTTTTTNAAPTSAAAATKSTTNVTY